MTRRKQLKNVAATVVLLCSVTAYAPASAQAVPPAPTPPVTALAFVTSVVGTDIFQVESAQLAQKRAVSADVKQFAQLMERAHDDLTHRLKWLLTKREPNIVLPTQMFATYMFVMDELVPLYGAPFEQRYIAQQILIHREALKLAEYYARSGDELDLKHFAEKSAQELRQHLDMITAIDLRHRASARIVRR